MSGTLTTAEIAGSPARADTPSSPKRAPGRARSAVLRAVGLKLAAVVIALGGWHWFAVTTGEAAGVPTPVQLVQTLSDLVLTGEFWSAVGSTLLSAIIGFALSVLIGVPIGLINGTLRPVERSTSFVIDFGRTIPGVAVLPIVLLLYGSTRTMVLVLVVFSAVWPILVQSTYAAQQLSPQIRQVAKAYRFDLKTRIRTVYVPSALPFIMTGLRISATISLLITISSEFLGGASGLGSRLFNTLTVNDTHTMFAYVVTSALLGVLLNVLLEAAQGRLLWWHPSQREKTR